MSWDTIAPYNRGFREFTEAYEAFGFDDVHATVIAYLPAGPGLVLDVGAGSGRDADWFAKQGWDVIAVEPASAMRAEAARRHGSPRIRWIDDSLPSLAVVSRLGLSFDLIWLSGVWTHVPPHERERSLRKLAMLLKPGGRLVVTLRHGAAPEGRPMWPAGPHELERLGLDFGLALRVATERVDDLQGRADVRWQTVVLDLPDDGAGALPLLRGVILRQEKSATYKLALLRCIARIADTSPNAVKEGEDHVELPLGLIALYWIRMFKPLVEQGLPQRPGERMGFVTDTFRALAPIAASDLRPGASFYGDLARALRLTLGRTARLIADMPATHLTFANNAPVFPTIYGRMPPASDLLVIQPELLWQLGTTRVPQTIWHALRRMAAWIEPMLVGEWVRLSQSYALGMGRVVSVDAIITALRCIDPDRDTGFVRSLAVGRLARGETVRCVWTDRPLTATSLDIDHCLPWSAWPCGDLWNLLPAAPTVNRHGKRGKIISSATLAEARPRILDWWGRAYLEAGTVVRTRFVQEARSTLPLQQDREPALDELFEALDFRRLRLRQDTQVPEWSGQLRAGRALPGNASGLV